MHITTTFRHMESSQAVRQYAIERLNKIRKYFRREPIAAHAVFSVENEHHHAVELQLTLPNGLTVQAHEATEDMYSSIDLAGARIERQVRRWKDKIRDHKPHGPGVSVKDRVMPAADLEPRLGKPGKAAKAAPAKGKGKLKVGVNDKVAARAKAGRAQPAAPAAAPITIIKEQTYTVRHMRLDDAVMQMNLVESHFLVFSDADTGAIAVVYRRKDGAYGVIDTGATVSAPKADQKAGQKAIKD